MLSRIILAETSPLRRTITATAVMGFVAVTWIVLGATPAVADEFTVGVVADPGSGGEAGAAYLEGFQLAVDQSPDVSHPAGTEGGDHLGSMDVNIVAVVDVAGPGELIDAAIDMIERSGAAIIVADVPPEILGAIHGPITSSGTMLIATADTGDAEFPETPYFFAAAQRDRLEDLLTDRTPAFEEAFAAAYGVAPSDVATRGYLAGRLVDISVEATDRDPSDVEALVLGLVGEPNASPVTPSADADPLETTMPATVEQAQAEDETSDTNLRLIIPVVVLVAIGGLVFGAWRRRVTSR